MKLLKFFAYVQIHVMYYYITNTEIMESKVYMLLGSEWKCDSDNSAEVK